MKSTSIPLIISCVSQHTGVAIADILSGRRQAHLVRARHIVMWICRYYTAESLQSIASALHCRNHATVIHGVTQIDNAIYCQRTLGDSLHALAKSINK